MVATALFALWPRDALARVGSHSDPIAPVILSVASILFFALLGRYAARRFGQPSVLGEVTVGILLGNIAYIMSIDTVTVLREGTAVFSMIDLALGRHSWEEAAAMVFGADLGGRILAIIRGDNGIEILQIAQTVDVFSRYGIIFLLFLVGLETNLDEMRRVGRDSLRVAVLGVVFPFVLGFAVLKLMLPALSLDNILFVAAALGATSVGITARVLKELGRTQSIECHIILGAAVIDDILGLIMLAVVSGIVVSGSIVPIDIVRVFILSGLFVFGAYFLGPHFLRIAIYVVRKMDVTEAKLFVSFLFVMALAWLANLAGLATLVGAFAAGLLLHDGYFKHWGDVHHHHLTIKDLIGPLEGILVPIFFVLMGMQVKLELFLDATVIMMAAGMLATAVLGKVASGLGARRGVSRLLVGFGMMPRGEVGLVFASIGKSLNVITDELFAAIVLMVILTTLFTPPLLKWTIATRPGQVED